MLCRNLFLFGLFDNFQIGRITQVNTDTNIVQGTFVGLIDGVLILTAASVFSATTGAFIYFAPVIRIPVGRINYVS